MNEFYYTIIFTSTKVETHKSSMQILQYIKMMHVKHIIMASYGR